MGKIERLNKQIARLERKIEYEEMKIEDAHEQCEAKSITKAEFTRIKMACAERERSFRNAIARKQKARLVFERKKKEKEEKKRKKLEERDRKYEAKLARKNKMKGD